MATTKNTVKTSVNVNKLFTEKELKAFEKGLLTNASFYKEFKAKLELDKNLVIFFRENSPKQICLELFGEEWLEKNPLSVPSAEKGGKAQNTTLYTALQNLKRLCKEPKEKGNGKKWEQIARELDYLNDNFASYSKGDQNSILAHFEKVAKTLGYEKTK